MPTHKRKDRQCEMCHCAYTPTYTEQRTCSRMCGVALRYKVTKTYAITMQYIQTEALIATCIQCGLRFLAASTRQGICSDECRRTRICEQIKTGYHDGRYRDQLLAAAHNRRARMLAMTDTESISLTVVAERDKWTCGICHKPVPTQTPKDDRSQMASLDHVIPVAKGGQHTYDNIQLAHYRCNLSKGDRYHLA
jgi:5-methylcytosine-specific restriction endonuclease McrA